MVTKELCVYTPASTRATRDCTGTLTKDNTPVAPRVTEPLLQNFFDVVGQMESDLASRWSSLAGHLTTHQPE
jgi:hypothetical protein